MDSEQNGSIYNTSFFLLCLSTLLFSASFNMIIPELPNYLTSLGGAEHKGLIIALFTLTAGISRPFSGKLTDKWGRVPVMAIGSIVCVICGFLYPILSSLSGFFLLRLIHGFSTGFKPTATSAYIADIIPSNRWGEALGMHGLCYSLGSAIGPALGGYIAHSYDIDTMFYCSSLFALLSIIIVFNMRETLKNKSKFRLSMLYISRKDILEIKVLPAAIVMLLCYSSSGVILTLIPDWSENLGIANKGLFFTVYTIASVAIRLLSRKAADQHGRTIVMRIGIIIITISLFILSYGGSVNNLILGAAVFGIGSGILSPALNAWTIDLSDPDHRGRAMATMYIALEVGIGFGALFAGYIYHDIINRIPQILFGNAIVVFLALLYIYYWDNIKKTQHY